MAQPVDALHYVHNAWCHPQPYTTQHAPLQFRQLTLSHIPDRTATPNSLVRIPESARVEPGQNLRATFTPAFSWPILQPWLRTTLKVPSDAAQAQLSSSPPSIRKVHTPCSQRLHWARLTVLELDLPAHIDLVLALGCQATRAAAHTRRAHAHIIHAFCHIVLCGALVACAPHPAREIGHGAGICHIQTGDPYVLADMKTFLSSSGIWLSSVPVATVITSYSLCTLYPVACQYRIVH